MRFVLGENEVGTELSRLTLTGTHTFRHAITIKISALMMSMAEFLHEATIHYVRGGLNAMILVGFTTRLCQTVLAANESGKVSSA